MPLDDYAKVHVLLSEVCNGDMYPWQIATLSAMVRQIAHYLGAQGRARLVDNPYNPSLGKMLIFEAVPLGAAWEDTAPCP